MSVAGMFGVVLLFAVGLFVVLIVIGNMLYDPKEHSAQLAVEECRKAENDGLLSIDARRLARGACNLLEQEYKNKYGRAP